MARYKFVDMSPRLLPVVLEEQLVPGSFAHAVHHLVDVLDLSGFDAHWRNDDTGTSAHAPSMLLKAMRARTDSDEGRQQYGRRFATVEPVFGNLRHNKRLNRFTLRGRHKVDGQWKLFALVHNIEKWANYRKAA